MSSVSDIIPSAGMTDADNQPGQIYWHAGPNA
ncbi:MAG: hypothetical protein ACI85N_000407, partial [Gammaproteobacteria bacterium]